MAQYDITAEVQELKAFGVTIAELVEEFGDRIDVNENRAYVWNRSSRDAFELFAAKRRKHGAAATSASVSAPVVEGTPAADPYAALPSQGTVAEVCAALVKALGSDADVYNIGEILSEVYRPFAQGRLLALDVDRGQIPGIVNNILAG